MFKWFLYAISFTWIAMGSGFILYTQKCRTALSKMLDPKYEKFIFGLIIAIGVLLMFSAPHSRNFGVVIFLGIIATVKGILLIFIPRNLYGNMKKWYLQTASDQTYRFFGIVMLIIGVAVATWV